MSLRSYSAFVIAILFTASATACMTAARSVASPPSSTTDATPARTPPSPPPNLAAQLVRLAQARVAADDDGRREVNTQLVSEDGFTAVVEATWEEDAPDSIEALDDAPLRVVRRYRIDGRDESMTPVAPPSWTLSGEIVACVDGRSDLLESIDSDEVDAGYHVERAPAEGDCIVLRRGAHVTPTGERIEVPAPGPAPSALAFRIRIDADEKVYWARPANACRGEVELDDGTIAHPVATCSAVGDDVPRVF